MALVLKAVSNHDIDQVLQVFTSLQIVQDERSVDLIDLIIIIDRVYE